MGIETKIGWTDATINFWHGCKKVSDGCKYCYMYRDKDRYGQNPTTVIKRKKADILRDLKKIPAGSKIFTCSWSDFFIEEADEWRAEAWDIIRDHPQFIWQILTKRPERMTANLPTDWGKGWPNVWLGVSVENESNYVGRLIALQNLPAAVKFLSMEPLLSDVELHYPLAVFPSGPPRCCNGFECGCYGMPTEPGIFYGIDWVIIGGESGNETGKYTYRECKEEWIERIINECNYHSVPVFVKQMGTHIAKAKGYKARHGDDPSEWPEELQVQEFPNK